MVKIWIYWCRLESSWFFHLCMFVLSRSVMSNSLQPCGLGLPGLLCPWDFPRQEYWNRLPFPSPGYLPNPRFFTIWATREALVLYICVSIRVGKNIFMWLWFWVLWFFFVFFFFCCFVTIFISKSLLSSL